MKQKPRLLLLLAIVALPGAFVGRVSAQTAIAITGNDQMKYDVTHIDAKPGEMLKITLKNAGTLPKAAMAHNWVLLKKSTDPAAYTTAAAKAKIDEYFPTDLSDKVFAHTRLLGPGESDTITFTAPTEPGDYVYVCSFPAHYLVGMKGVLSVK